MERMRAGMMHRDYVGTALGSRASINVLRALLRYDGKTYTERGLAEDARISHPAASRIVNELEGLGIVRIHIVGRSHQVVLNKHSHVLKRIIVPVFEAEERLLSSMILTLKKHLDVKDVISAAVFGSTARMQEKDGSDVDVIVIAKHDERATAAMADAIEDVFARFHIDVSPTFLSAYQFRKRKNEAFVRSVLRDNIPICGKNLGEIAS